MNMDTSLALVPVHAFSPFFSKADSTLANYTLNFARSDLKAEYILDEYDGLDRMYGAAGREIGRAVKGTLIDTYI